MNYFDKNDINYALVTAYECEQPEHVTVTLQDGQQISLENDESVPDRVNNFIRTRQAYENAVTLLANDHNVNNDKFDQYMDVLRQNDYRNNS